jgi:hypothetical protein
MSNRALLWAFRLKVAGAPKAVLVALANCLNDRTGRCDPSHTTLALYAGVDERTVRRACASLQASHLVEIIERPGRPSQYKLAVGTKIDTPGTTPDLVADEPRTPCPTPLDATPVGRCQLGEQSRPRHHSAYTQRDHGNSSDQAALFSVGSAWDKGATGVRRSYRPPMLDITGPSAAE